MQSQISEQDLIQIKHLLEMSRENALVIELPTPGVLRLAGATSRDLLNRMSTNDLSSLPVNTIRESVLTTATARIIDRIWILGLEAGTMVLTSPHQGAKVIDWLHKHIFFQDDVVVSSDDGGWSLWEVLGPEANLVLASTHPDLLTPDENTLVTDEGFILWYVQRPVPGLRILLHSEQATLLQELSTRSHDKSLVDQAYEILRIRAGVPHSPNEINLEYIPLEVGLWDAVSFSKGCYTGQEIIARMESRGKLARQLTGYTLSGYAPPGSPIHQGKRLLGPLTSIAHSPYGGWIGLGITKPLAEGEEIGSLSVGEDGVRAEIREFSVS